MKTAKFDFFWFEEEDRRKILRASVCTDCKLHAGEELKLPQIALELGLTQDEVIEMGRGIGKEREAFYTVTQ